MCGIAGIWNAPRADADSLARVAVMLSAMRHRGPDGAGSLEFPGGAAGMVRLAMLDPTSKGQQPMWSPEGNVAILFNGEMYNFRAERTRLEARGHRFVSRSDTEVVLRLYLEHGHDCLAMIRGMFALAIFDFRRQHDGVPELVLARDPLGMKPLYVSHWADRRLAFSSELRPLLRAGVAEREISHDGLIDFLTAGYISAPQTLVAGVRLLEPGVAEIHRVGEARRQLRFWSAPPYAPLAEAFEASAERLRAVLDESVALHAFADAPLGVLFSGGLDSTALLRLILTRVPQVKTFTLSTPHHRELGIASRVEALAQQLGCAHQHLEIGPADIAALYPRFVRDLDQPSTDGLNTWLVTRGASASVKGVLSGLGGDELFAGYPVHRRIVRREEAPLVQTVAAHLAHRVCEGWRPGRVADRAHAFADRRAALATWARPHTVFSDTAAARLLGVSAGARLDRLARQLDRAAPGWQTETALGQAFHLDTASYLREQLLRDADHTSMAHGVELRTPFVDVEVVNFSRSCRDEYKLTATARRGYGEGSKRVLVEAMRDLLPSGIDQQGKEGFALPFAAWLTGPLQPFVEAATSVDAVRARGLFSPDAVTALVGQTHRRGSALYPELWALAVLEGWCSHVLDQAPRLDEAQDVALRVFGGQPAARARSQRNLG